MPPKGAKKFAASAADSMDSLYFKHYTEQVAKHGSQTAILLQVGKFFEMYDSVDVSSGISRANVQTIAEICGSVVEPKPTSDPSRQRLFWGFPEISLAKFERLLVAAGYTVVVIVQNKDATGDVTSRTIDHISSPGTFWDAEGGLAVRREEQIMLGVYVETYTDVSKSQTHWYVASSAFDVMTGKCVSTEADLTVIDGKPVFDSIQPFWAVYPPAEVVFWWCSTAPQPSAAALAAIFSSSGKKINIHIQAVEPKKESAIASVRLRMDFLESVYKHDSALSIAEYLGIERYHFIPRSLCHLLEFIKDHNPSFLTQLHSHTVWTPEDNVLLGNAALEQLAMIPVNPEKANESLLYWLQKALTVMGKRTLRERLLKPTADIKILEERQERIEALRNPSVRTPLEIQLKGIFDLSRLYRRFQLGNGTTDDLLQMLSSYTRTAELIKQSSDKLFEAQDSFELSAHIDAILQNWDAERIRASKSLVSDAIAVGSVHPWRRGIHTDLDDFEDKWRALEKTMLSLKSQWEEYIEEDNCVTWTVKEDAPFTFSTTARRANSLTAVLKQRKLPSVNQVKRGAATTVFLENDAVNAANKTAIALRADWKAAVAVHWQRDWQTWMNDAIQDGLLEAMIEFIGRLDAECAFAKVAEEYGYVRPIYVDSEDGTRSGFSVREMRHPIIERINNSTTYISHNLAFGSFASEAAAEDESTAAAESTILLYGVNAAGKSSLGKAIGLTILMAQCGIPVPASYLKLVPYTGIFTRILGNDNLWAGMSSFVVEMTEFRSILRSAGPHTLVIGDELCAGTETASATAIVAAGLQTLSARQSHCFFATHLHELVNIPEISNNRAITAYHLTVHPDLTSGRLIYDRKLRRGCGSPMYGLEVCRGLDMDAEFLRLAFDFRKRLFTAGYAHGSAYNPKVIVRACEVCGDSEALETHHIVPQASADKKGKIAAGVHKNTAANLVVLCEDCHTKHHSGMLEIQGWVATSGGRKLSYLLK